MSLFMIGDLVIVKDSHDYCLYEITRLSTVQCDSFEEYENLDLSIEDNLRYCLRRVGAESPWNILEESPNLTKIEIPSSHIWNKKI